MSREPKISVIVPVYNVEKYLARCLDSVLAQTSRDFEAVCVDDGSTDASPEILARYVAEHDRLRVIRKENGGLSSARNAGLDAARGEYVWFVDSDDLIPDSRALELLCARCAETRADVLNFSGDADYETEAVRRARGDLNAHLHISGAYPDGLSGQELYVRLVDGWDYIPSACLHLFRREFLEKNRLRFAEGLLFEDQLFTLQALSLARRTAQQEGCFYRYCVREGSIMTAAKLQRHADNYYRISAELARFYRERLDGAPEAFRDRYFRRVRLLAQQGTDCLRALPRGERRAVLRALDDGARRIAKSDIARAPWRALMLRARACKRRIRRMFK